MPRMREDHTKRGALSEPFIPVLIRESCVVGAGQVQAFTIRFHDEDMKETTIAITIKQMNDLKAAIDLILEKMPELRKE